MTRNSVMIKNRFKDVHNNLLKTQQEKELFTKFKDMTTEKGFLKHYCVKTPITKQGSGKYVILIFFIRMLTCSKNYQIGPRSIRTMKCHGGQPLCTPSSTAYGSYYAPSSSPASPCAWVTYFLLLQICCKEPLNRPNKTTQLTFWDKNMSNNIKNYLDMNFSCKKFPQSLYAQLPPSVIFCLIFNINNVRIT